MRGNNTQANPDFKMKKEKDKRSVRDDFYDRINYYESRNIFSSNEPFNPSNRLYTDHASLSHPVWNAIKQTNENFREIKNEMSIDKKQDSSFDKELTQNLLSSINKLNTNSSSSSIGCKKCGYVGHLSYQCRNNIKLKNSQNKTDTITMKIDNNIAITEMNLENTEQPLEKEKKKKKKDKKDKKRKKEKSRFRSRSHSRSISQGKDKHEKSQKKDKEKIRLKSRSISRSKSRSRTPRKERKYESYKRKDNERIRNKSISRSRSRTPQRFRSRNYK